MPTPVMPLRRIRIHKQRGFGHWSAFCPCCWAQEGKGIYITRAGFRDACRWTARHIADNHPKAT